MGVLEGIAMPSINMNTQNFMMYFWWFMLFVGFVAVGIFVLIFSKYKYRIIIFEKRANNITKVLIDRAKMIKSNKTSSLRLWKSRYNIPLLEGQKYTFIKGKKDIYFYIKVDDDHILPITMVERPIGFRPIPQDLKFWLFEQWRKTEAIYGEDNFWQKNAGTLISIAGLAMVLVLVIIILGQFTEVNEGLLEVAKAIKSVKLEPIIPG